MPTHLLVVNFVLALLDIVQQILERAVICTADRIAGALFVATLFEELQQIWVCVQILSHCICHLVVVHVLRQLKREAFIPGHQFITEIHFDSIIQFSETSNGHSDSMKSDIIAGI